MFDDLRDQASTFLDDHEPHKPEPRPHTTRHELLGMTPLQRFLVALMLFVITFLLSSVCLLAAGKIGLPFVS